MTEPSEQVRSLLHLAADEMPGGPVTAPLPDLLDRVGPRRRHRGLWVAAAFVLVLVVVAVPAWIIRRPEREPVALPSYAVPTVTGYAAGAPGGVAALAPGHLTELPAAPIAGRDGAATVWTGEQMLIWGGDDGAREYADGAAYDPDTARWEVLPPGPLSARANPAFVWTGRELFIWGGTGDDRGDGALYDPSTHTWRSVATAPVATQPNPIALWTGRQVVVISGADGEFGAAAYDPTSNQWARLPAIPFSHPTHRVAAAATPDGIYVWSYWSEWDGPGPGYAGRGTAGIDLSRYDPPSGTWTSVHTQRPSDLKSPLWTGRELVFPATGTYYGDPPPPGPMPYHLSGWRWDPPAGTWQRIAHGPVDDHRPTSVWTGAALLSFDASGSGSIIDANDRRVPHLGAAAAWDPATNTWQQLPDAPFISGRGASAVWVGSRLLFWGLMRSSSDDDSPYRTVGLSFGP